MARTALTAMILAALSLSALACGDDDAPEGPATTPSVPTATVAPNTSPAPDASATPDDVMTGIDSIDLIAHGVRKDGTRGLGDLVRYLPVACTTTVEGIGGPPQCNTGEAEGTEVLVVFAASCEGYYSRAEELPFAHIELETPALYGAFPIDASSPLRRPWPDARYAVILNRALLGDGTGVFALFADDEDIVGFSEGCGETPAQYAEAQGLTDAVIVPR